MSSRYSLAVCAHTRSVLPSVAPCLKGLRYDVAKRGCGRASRRSDGCYRVNLPFRYISDICDKESALYAQLWYWRFVEAWVQLKMATRVNAFAWHDGKSRGAICTWAAINAMFLAMSVDGRQACRGVRIRTTTLPRPWFAHDCRTPFSGRSEGRRVGHAVARGNKHIFTIHMNSVNPLRSHRPNQPSCPLRLHTFLIMASLQKRSGLERATLDI